MDNENNQINNSVEVTDNQPLGLEAKPKKSKWRYFFIIIGCLQFAAVMLFLLMFAGIGSGFLSLLVLTKFIPLIGILTVVNLIGLPTYMIKHSQSRKELVFSILSMMISGVFCIYLIIVIFIVIATGSMRTATL